MFSSRLDWELPSNALSLLLAEKRARGGAILDLTESNPTRAGLDYDSAAILAALADPAALTYEPAPAGLPAAREAVASYYATRGERVSPDRVVLTASTSEAYSLAFKILADPGDEVLVPRPSYPLFDYLARLESLTVRQYPLHYHDGWWIDFPVLESAIGPRTRAVVVVNPNNPTGSFLKREESNRLLDLAERHSLAIISDEVFADYAFAVDENRVESLADARRGLVFCLSGLSKIIGLPQLKLGWIVVSGAEHLQRQALARLELIADTYLSVGAPVQHAAARLLRLREQLQAQLIRRLRGNLEQLQQSSAHTLAVEGGWYAIIRPPALRTEEQWALSLLQDDDVLVQPGYFYDFETEPFLVLSLLPPPASFREGLARLLRRFNHT